MKMVCIGDSLTYGYGVKPAQCWVSLAAERSGNEMVNKGINGDTTAGMLARFDRDVLTEKPDAVFIMGGVNDIMTGKGAEEAKKNLLVMVQKARNAGIKPLVGAPAAIYEERITPGWKAFAGVEDFSEIIREADGFCKWVLENEELLGGAVVNFYTPFVEVIAGENPKPYFADGLHPGKKGHALMAEVFAGE